MDCAGNDCTLTCQGSTACKMTGCTGDCTLNCNGAPDCELSCDATQDCTKND